MIKFLVSMSVILCLFSCASQPIPIAYQCPTIQLPPDPPLATQKLTAKSTSSEIVKAWVASAIALKGWNTVVREQLGNR